MISDLIKGIGSVRKYSDKALPREDLQYIVDAVRYSSFDGERLTCIIGVIDDKNLISELAKCCGSRKWVETAPVIAAICTKRMADEDIEAEKFRLGKLKDELYDIDPNVIDIICAKGHQALVAAQNMALAAYEKGLSSSIVSDVNVYKASKVLEVPNSHLVTYLVTLGYGEASQAINAEPDEDVVFYNIYDK